jgi:Tol biopolymer transport system component
MERYRLRDRVVTLLLGALAAGALAPESLPAQYFGQNKVQYRTFDFQVLRSPHFDVYFYPEEEVAARDAARMAERWYDRLSTMLDHEFELRQPVVLYGSHPAFQQTTTLQGDIGEGTGGVTEALKQRVIMPLAGSYQETDHVMGHELVHAFQYDISGLGRFRGTLGAGARAFGGAPLWFTEGMAEYLSVGPIDPHTAMWLRDAVLTGNLPDHDQLNRDPSFFPYRWGQALWAYVGGRWGDPTIGQILRLVGQGLPYPDAFERVLLADLEDVIADWHVAIRRSYLPMLPDRAEAREAARALITEDRDGGTLNIGPSVSPDGRYVAFISELDFIDAELHLADARTGEVIRRLQRGAAFDSHFQSLRYINSAGTWAPDSRRFAFSALKAGSDVLVIMDVERANVLEEVRIDGVSEISTPTWSPDGRTIVFAGIEGGVSDLYAYDVETEQSRQLTDDLYANMHPTFSPDGSLIAYVTEEGPGTDLESLQYAPYRIMLMELSTGAKRTVPAMGEGANVNPQWTRDGAGIYFISNRSGIPNIYRVDLASGQLFQVTELFGGVSGITDTSPALTVARNDNRLLFTAYEESNYNIYTLTSTEDLAGTLVDEAAQLAMAEPLPAHLPPVPRPQQGPFTRVASTIADVTSGLPSRAATAQWEVSPYRPRLVLDYLGQPQVGVAVGGYAGQGGLYGAVSGIFSDLLGHHTVMGAVQAQGQYDELGFQTVYLNQKHRYNWGALAQRIPYIYLRQRYACAETGCPNNDVGELNMDFLRVRTFDAALTGLAQYPFSPAWRVEASAGLRRISQDIVVDRIRGISDFVNGQPVNFDPVSQERFKEPGSSAAFNMAQASAALVYDNALFGYTSPFAGQRYRFELAPTVGEISFVQALADYRRYLYLRPFTLAVRGLHTGRYGRDDDVFYPTWMGNPYFMRGYYSAYGDCRDGETITACDVYGSMLGTRIAVANAELRFPLIRALVIGPIGFPPIEGIAFYDAGVAWDRNTTPVFERGTPADPSERGIVSSTGVGARINLLGFAVLEVDYVKPLDGDRDWHWQFAFQPGF